MKKFLLLYLLSVVGGLKGMAQMSSFNQGVQNQTVQPYRNPLRDSLAAATEALAYHPDSIDLRLKKSSWNIQLEQWEYAKDDLDKVLYIDPTNIAGLFYRAFVNDKMMRYNFARLDYQNLLTLVPGNFEAQLGLALLNQKDKHYTEAYDQINMLIEANPDSAVAFAARAGMEKERNMLETAAYDYQRAYELDTMNIDYLTNLLDLNLLLRRKKESRECLKALMYKGVRPSALKEFGIRLKKIKK